MSLDSGVRDSLLFASGSPLFSISMGPRPSLRCRLIALVSLKNSIVIDDVSTLTSFRSVSCRNLKQIEHPTMSVHVPDYVLASSKYTPVLPVLQCHPLTDNMHLDFVGLLSPWGCAEKREKTQGTDVH